MAYLKMSSFVTKQQLTGNELIIGLDGRNIKVPLETLRVFFQTSATFGFRGNIMPNSPYNGLNGIYVPVSSGEYVNFGGIVVDLEEGLTLISKDETGFEKITIPINLQGYLRDTEITLTDLVADIIVPGFQTVIATGVTQANANYVTTEFFRVSDQVPITMTRGESSAQSIAFYDGSQTYIGGVSGGASPTVTINPPSGAVWAKTNPSSNPATRDADLAAFGVYQFSAESGAKIEGIRGLGIVAEDLKDKRPFVMKQSVLANNSDIENIYTQGQVEDDTYVYSNGAIGTGASAPPTEYAMARIPIDREINTQIAWRREATPGTFGFFFDRNLKPISGVTGVNGVDTGVSDIPEGAEWIYTNVSSNSLARSLEKSRFTVVYGDTIPPDFLPQKTLKAIAGLEVPHPYSGVRAIAIGDSITTYERVGTSGQNPLSNYFVRACANMGALMLQNYSIGGSTISQRAEDPTGRNPISIRYVDMRDDADLIIVSAGTNDCTHAWTPIGTFSDSTVNTFYGAMHVLCQGLKEKYIGGQIVFLTPIRRYHAPAGMTTPTSPNANGETPQQYVDAILEVCGYYSIPVFDRFKKCRLWPFMEEYRDAYMNDGTHPNAEGHIIMADDLTNFLRGL